MVGLNLTLKLKQNPPEETDKEWIEAHIENAVRDGKYIGRAEVFNFHPNYFRSLNNPDKIDSEIKYALESRFGKDIYSNCDLKHKCNTSRKSCRHKHDYFTDCTRISD
jgi:hypothetical protein